MRGAVRRRLADAVDALRVAGREAELERGDALLHLGPERLDVDRVDLVVLVAVGDDDLGAERLAVGELHRVHRDLQRLVVGQVAARVRQLVEHGAVGEHEVGVADAELPGHLDLRARAEATLAVVGVAPRLDQRAPVDLADAAAAEQHLGAVGRLLLVRAERLVGAAARADGEAREARACAQVGLVQDRREQAVKLSAHEAAPSSYMPAPRRLRLGFDSGSGPSSSAWSRKVWNSSALALCVDSSAGDGRSMTAAGSTRGVSPSSDAAVAEGVPTPAEPACWRAAVTPCALPGSSGPGVPWTATPPSSSGYMISNRRSTSSPFWRTGGSVKRSAMAVQTPAQRSPISSSTARNSARVSAWSQKKTTQSSSVKSSASFDQNCASRTAL